MLNKILRQAFPCQTCSLGTWSLAFGDLNVVCVLWAYVFSFFQSNPPQVVQDKILSLIQDWADAFRGSPDLTYVLETYESLRAQGLKVLLYSV